MCVPRAALSSGQTGAGPGRVKASGVPTEALVLQGCQLSPPPAPGGWLPPLPANWNADNY